MNTIGTRVLEASLLLSGLGFLVSRVTLLVWLNGQSAVFLFLLWYVVLYAFLQVASLVLFRSFGLTSLRVGLGLVLVWFAAGIVFYWPSSLYVEQVLGVTIPSLALATEDQVTSVFFASVLGLRDTFVLGLATYVLAPFVLSQLGFLVLGHRRTAAVLEEIFTPEGSRPVRARAARAFALLFAPDGMHHVGAQ